MTIAGRPAGGRHWLPVEDPALGTEFADAPDCTEDELDAAVGAAAAAFPGWSALPEPDRREALIACGTALAGRAPEVAELLTREQGKPLPAALAETRLAADWFRHTAALSLRPELLAQERQSEVTLRRTPHGVVAAIAPSNFPVILAVTKLAPALLAGNTVVLKPAPATPLATLRMGEVLAPLLPPGVLNVVSGDGALGPRLSGHPGVGMISFTGSVASGRAIARGAAARFQPVVLELGGNDAGILLPGVDVGRVATAVFDHAMANSGQFCAAIKRVYVSRQQQPELVEALAALASGTTVGNGLDPATDLGPLVSRRQRDRVSELVGRARQAGGRIVTGGEALPGPGYFYPPTVVTDLPPGTRLETTEQFGPVIPVLAYDHVDEAVARANGTEFGLGGSVWGEEPAARAVAARLDCGTAWVNTHGVLRPDAPFGGVRSSGIGVEYGYWGLLEYTRIRVSHVYRDGPDVPAIPGRLE
jgi:acyl-CoA reductase-like NAD-dependent aldehyde dehydrogenase